MLRRPSLESMVAGSRRKASSRYKGWSRPGSGQCIAARCQSKYMRNFALLIAESLWSLVHLGVEPFVAVPYSQYRLIDRALLWFDVMSLEILNTAQLCTTVSH